jgi:hypothetical protein
MKHSASLITLPAIACAVLLLSLSTPPRVQANNEPNAAQLTSEINALRNRVTVLENARAASNGRVMAAPGDNLSARVQTLSKEVSNLTSVVKVTPGAGVVIDANRISLNAGSQLTVASGAQMTLHGGYLSIDAGQNLTIKAGSNAQIQSGAQLALSGGAVTKVTGPTVVFNNGASPIVTQNSVKSGGGSPTVLAP